MPLSIGSERTRRSTPTLPSPSDEACPRTGTQLTQTLMNILQNPGRHRHKRLNPTH